MWSVRPIRVPALVRVPPVRHDARVSGDDVVRTGANPVRVGWGSLVALAGTASLVAWRTPSTDGDLAAVQALAFVGLVLLVAVVGGAACALLGTLLGAAAMAWGYTSPGHTVADASGAERATWATFVVVGLVLTGVAAVAARRRRLAREERAADQHEAERERSEAVTWALRAERGVRSGSLTAAALDLRAPAAILHAATEMLRVAGDRLADADRVELHELVRETATRVRRIADDLHVFGRLEAGTIAVQLSEVPLRALVDAACVGVSAKQIAVGTLPVVRVDPGLLQRALTNVLANAARYSDRLEVLAEQRGSTWELRVVDHGPGVSPADWPWLFEPFHRLDDLPDSEGVGLTLGVARGLVEAQGGTVRAEVTLGGGLTVVVALPVDAS
jgi:two-component system sensor histidine kinase KdpD